MAFDVLATPRRSGSGLSPAGLELPASPGGPAD
jgi:hypothetical protein